MPTWSKGPDMQPDRLSLFTGYRHHQRYRWVTDVNGKRVMNSQLAEFDWGSHVSIAWRRPLAAGLLYHCGLAAHATQDVVDAFAAEIVTQFAPWGWSITREEIVEWLVDFHARNLEGRRNA